MDWLRQTTNDEDSSVIQAVAITPDRTDHTESEVTGHIAPTEQNEDDRVGTTDRIVEDFTADLNNYQHQEELALMMMLGTNRGTKEMPTLQTSKWKYAGKSPNPISIRRARRFLATAYAKIPCELAEAGVHGYAWIVEEPTQWDRRKGTRPITPPVKPIKRSGMDLQEKLDLQDRMDEYLLYFHLIQAGTDKLVEWFGKSMFLDCEHFNNGELDADTAPRDLLVHLEETYSTGADELEYLEVVNRTFNTPYDRKRPVEEYFMRLQETQTDSVDLKVPFFDAQMMTQALSQFIKAHGKDGRKSANKWHTKTEKTWKDFKTFWKKSIHEWSRAGSMREANAVDRLTDEMGTIKADMQALLVENRFVKEQNDELTARQHDVEYALQVDTARHRTRGTDDDSTISTITEALGQLERRMEKKLAAYSANLSSSSDTTITDDATRTTDQQNRLTVAKNRRPDGYKHLNGGRGKQYMFYCSNCGVNCTHNTDRCYELLKEQKEKYKGATVTNRMNGSDKHLERFGRFQHDYNFDSL